MDHPTYTDDEELDLIRLAEIDKLMSDFEDQEMCIRDSDGLGEELEQDKAHEGGHQIAGDGQLVDAAHAGILLCTVVKADDGLRALRDADDDGEQDGVGLHDDAAGG